MRRVPFRSHPPGTRRNTPRRNPSARRQAFLLSRLRVLRFLEHPGICLEGEKIENRRIPRFQLGRPPRLNEPSRPFRPPRFSRWSPNERQQQLWRGRPLNWLKTPEFLPSAKFPFLGSTHQALIQLLLCPRRFRARHSTALLCGPRRDRRIHPPKDAE